MLKTAALAAGGVVNSVGMLYLTIRDMIDAIGLITADHLLAGEDDASTDDGESGETKAM